MADIITIMNLGWKYPPRVQENQEKLDVEALHNLSCYIDKGTFNAILGPTACGKTTFAHTLTGVIPHMLRGKIAGYARVDGMNVKSVPPQDLSVSVGYVPQDPESAILGETVEEEVALPLACRGLSPVQIEQIAGRAMASMHVDALAKRNPRTLSSGELKRVSIARALAGGAEVLILDEPCIHLDSQGKADLFAVLDQLRREESTTIVMIEQETRELVKYADTLFVMVDGEFIRRTTAEIFSTEKTLLESVGITIPREQPKPLQVLKEDNHAENPAIVFNHVSYEYPQATQAQAPAVMDVSVQIPSGAFVGLVGENGSGKTTLAKMINGQLRPTSGQVTVDGVDVAGCTAAQMAREVAFVDQYPGTLLLCPTVREEIAFGLKTRHWKKERIKKRVQEMIRLFGLTGVADTDPHDLSYGEQRVISLACCLAWHPQILVLDEATAGLDHRLGHRFLNTIAKMTHEDTTVVMISQNMDDVQQYCSHVIHLQNGQMVSCGPLRKKERSLQPPAPSWTETGEQYNIRTLSNPSIPQHKSKQKGRHQ